MRKKTGGQVYPFAGYEGMTLRDYFAAHAMQALLGKLTDGVRPQDCVVMAEDAYFLADAMIKAREE